MIFIVLDEHGEAYQGSKYTLNLERFKVPLLLYTLINFGEILISPSAPMRLN